MSNRRTYTDKFKKQIVNELLKVFKIKKSLSYRFQDKNEIFFPNKNVGLF